MNITAIMGSTAGALAVVLAALVPFGSGWAADQPQRQLAMQAARAAKAPLLSVTRAGNRLVSVGDYGIVLLSDDQGGSWRQARRVETRAMLTSACFVSATLGWAVGHGGVVLQTRDGGENWQLQHTAAPDLALLSVWFGDERHGMAVGSFGRALQTFDGGNSWKELELGKGDDRDRHLNHIFPAPGGMLFVAAEAGTVFRSNDAGRSWKMLKPAYKGSFWNGMALRDGAILIVGMRGNAFRSSDNGDTWEQVDTGTTQALSGTTQLADGRVVAVGMSGTVTVSRDGGRTFESRTRADRQNLTGIAATTDGTVVLLGQSGVVSDALRP